MILLLSQDCFDATIEDVDDWIAALGGRATRLNGEDVNGDAAFAISLANDEAAPQLSIGAGDVDFDAVDAVWLRRWHTYQNVEFVMRTADAQLARDLREYLVNELRATTGAVFARLDGVPWLTSPDKNDVNKLVALRAAAASGLDVPATLVTNDRAALVAFQERHGRVITKSIWNSTSVHVAGRQFSMFTAEVTPDIIDATPRRFFPSLFQQRLEKELEVRVFYLSGAMWAMAIFSQLDPQTSLDFRVYNRKRPNRYVPYRLPSELEGKIRAFMQRVRLETGSLDFVRAPDGRHVFLEVNPVGQFGMVSSPCNYRLEKHLAQHLMDRADG